MLVLFEFRTLQNKDHFLFLLVVDRLSRKINQIRIVWCLKNNKKMVFDSLVWFTNFELKGLDWFKMHQLFVAVLKDKNLSKVSTYLWLLLRCIIELSIFIRVSQISKNFGPTVFCVLLNERKLVRPSLGILRVIFHVGQASKAHWSGGWFWLEAYWALKAWPTWNTTLNMPKLGLTSFLSLSRTQKTVGPKILEIWDTLILSPAQKKTGITK